MRHGTRTRYVTDGCRCEKCVKANAKYQKDYLRKRRARFALQQGAQKSA